MLSGSEFKEVKWAQISFSDFFQSHGWAGSSFTDAHRFPHACDSQSVLSGPWASEVQTDLWEVHILRPHPRGPESETLGGEWRAAIYILRSLQVIWMHTQVWEPLPYINFTVPGIKPLWGTGAIVSAVCLTAWARAFIGYTSISLLSLAICWDENGRRNLLMVIILLNFYNSLLFVFVFWCRG